MKRVLYTTFVLLFFGCTHSNTIELSQEVETNNWYSGDKIKFEFDVKDTVNFHQLYLKLRVGEDYPYQNLYLFGAQELPNGVVQKDTLEFILSDPYSGKWLGNSTGSLVEFEYLIKKGVLFPLSGKYILSFEHGMRTNPLPFIYDLGMELKPLQE